MPPKLPHNPFKEWLDQVLGSHGVPNGEGEAIDEDQATYPGFRRTELPVIPPEPTWRPSDSYSPTQPLTQPPYETEAPYEAECTLLNPCVGPGCVYCDPDVRGRFTRW